MEKPSYQKRPGIFIDEKLTFKHHIDDTLCNVSKGVALIRKTKTFFFTVKIFTILKVLLRPLMDYGDIIYDQPYSRSQNSIKRP